MLTFAQLSNRPFGISDRTTQPLNIEEQFVTFTNAPPSSVGTLVKRVLPENKVTVEEIVNKMAVKVNGNIMYGISPGTNASTMVNTVVTNKGTAKVYDAAGNLKTNGALATGDKIVINGSSDAATYYIAVRGDTSGDGVVKINDLILVQSHILGTRLLTDVRLYAGDVNYDGAIKINDLILVQSHILGKGNL